MGSLFAENVLLFGFGGVGLLKRHGEAVKHRFVHNARVSERTSLVALTLGVGSGDHGEASLGSDPFASLLDVDARCLPAKAGDT